MEDSVSQYYSRRKGGAGRGFKAKNVVPTLYQRRTNVVPTFFKRCTNVFKTFLKRRYDVFSKRETSLVRREKNEVRIFRIVFGKAAYAKDALSKFGRFTGPPVPAIPVPRCRGPRIPRKMSKLPESGKRKKTKLKRKRKQTEERTRQRNKTVQITTQTEKNDKTREKPEKNGGNEKRHHETQVFQEKTSFRQKTQGDIAGESIRAENIAGEANSNAELEAAQNCADIVLETTLRRHIRPYGKKFCFV